MTHETPPRERSEHGHDSGLDRRNLRGRPYVCLGCGAPMIEIGCKIRCRECGYFEDCGGGLTPPPVDSA